MRLQDATLARGLSRANSPDLRHSPRQQQHNVHPRPLSPSRPCRPSHLHQQQQPRPTYSPELVSSLRRYLQLAAAGPVYDSSRLQQALQRYIPLEEASFAAVWQDCTPWQTLAVQEDLQCVHNACERMLQLFAPAELAQLLTSHPLLLTSGLPAWLDFFEAYGFNPGQIKNIIVGSPQVLVQADVATAGLAILRLKALGFADEQVRHRVIPFCPQVLGMSEGDIDTLIRLWSKFKAGVDEQQ